MCTRTMAMDALTACKEIIEEVQKFSLVPHEMVNIQQCKLLTRKLLEAGNTIREIQESAVCEDVKQKSSYGDGSAWSSATKELYGVIERAQKLITSCCERSWLKIAIKKGTTLKQSFAESLYELQWCMSVLCSHPAIYSEIGPDHKVFGLKECDGKLSITDQFALSNAAKQDAKHLKKLLKTLFQDHVCSAECGMQSSGTSSRCLAAQLLDAAEQPEGCTNVPTVNPRDLPGGEWIVKGHLIDVQETEWFHEKYVKKLFRGESMKAIFEQEFHAVSRLSHPHVVRLVCTSEDENERALIMERMTTDLHELLVEKPFSYVQCVDILLQVALGMAYIHNQMGMAHGHLNSHCVFIDLVIHAPTTDLRDDYHVFYVAKVGNFGSTGYSYKTLNAGTRKWMAPEVWGLHEDEERATRFLPMSIDVYSFGIMAFEVLTGQEPFSSLPMKDVRTLVNAGQRPTLPKNTPHMLANLIQRCWDSNPLLRPDFSQICMELRYIKGLLLRGDESILQEKQDMCIKFKTGETRVQGPWGGSGGGYFYDGMAAKIERVKIKDAKVLDPCIRLLEVQYNINGTSFITYHGDVNYQNAQDTQIVMKQGEYLTQIEGSYGKTGAVGNSIGEGVVSLTLHTNLASYGPFGVEGEKSFKSEIGQIVGFYGKSGTMLDQIGVITLSPSTSPVSMKVGQIAGVHSHPHTPISDRLPCIPCHRIWELLTKSF